MAEDILVSVCIITYNHAKYIGEAIESVLRQRCNFRFELIIGEDCSKDNTREIVRTYAEKHPDIIIPLFPEKNQGATRNAANIFSIMRGKYYAFLEGDDFWIDDRKLQRQFDFMEGHPEYVFCFTDANTIDQFGKPAPSPFPELHKDDFTIADIIMTPKVFVPTATVFARTVLPKMMPQFYFEAYSGDIAIHLLLTDKGKAKRLQGATSVYREHPGGVTKSAKQLTEGQLRLVKLYAEANEYFDHKYDSIFKKRLSQLSKENLIYGSRDLKGLDKVKYVMKQGPYYWRYSDSKSLKELAYYFTLLFLPFLLRRGK